MRQINLEKLPKKDLLSTWLVYQQDDGVTKPEVIRIKEYKVKLKAEIKDFAYYRPEHSSEVTQEICDNFLVFAYRVENITVPEGTEINLANCENIETDDVVLEDFFGSSQECTNYIKLTRGFAICETTFIG